MPINLNTFNFFPFQSILVFKLLRYFLSEGLVKTSLPFLQSCRMRMDNLFIYFHVGPSQSYDTVLFLLGFLPLYIKGQSILYFHFVFYVC